MYSERKDALFVANTSRRLVTSDSCLSSSDIDALRQLNAHSGRTRTLEEVVETT